MAELGSEPKKCFAQNLDTSNLSNALTSLFSSVLVKGKGEGRVREVRLLKVLGTLGHVKGAHHATVGKLDISKL